MQLFIWNDQRRISLFFTDIDLMRLEAMETLETLNIKGNPLPDDVKSQLMDTRLNVIRNWLLFCIKKVTIELSRGWLGTKYKSYDWNNYEEKSRTKLF